ncbi:MAG: hypothetical protein WCT46_05120 [Candidatus Gracilibacteria bacterium]|jgi:hypothetical protein
MIYETKFLVALAGTSVVEVPLVFVLVRYVFKVRDIRWWRIVMVVLLASVLTLPYLWFVLAPYVDGRYYILTGEILVFLIEGFLYWQSFRIKWWKAFSLSLAANAVSYFVGPALIAFFL